MLGQAMAIRMAGRLLRVDQSHIQKPLQLGVVPAEPFQPAAPQPIDPAVPEIPIPLPPFW